LCLLDWHSVAWAIPPAQHFFLLLAICTSFENFWGLG
jgi:hypothetical protein